MKFFIIVLSTLAIGSYFLFASGEPRVELKIGDEAPNFMLEDQDGKKPDTERRAHGPVAEFGQRDRHSHLFLAQTRNIVSGNELGGAKRTVERPIRCGNDVDVCALHIKLCCSIHDVHVRFNESSKARSTWCRASEILKRLLDTSELGSQDGDPDASI